MYSANWMSLIKLNMSEHVNNCAMKCFLVESLTLNWPVDGKYAVDIPGTLERWRSPLIAVIKTERTLLRAG
jgi:hypothetical protein